MTWESPFPSASVAGVNQAFVPVVSGVPPGPGPYMTLSPASGVYPATVTYKAFAHHVGVLKFARSYGIGSAGFTGHVDAWFTCFAFPVLLHVAVHGRVVVDSDDEWAFVGC